ncbi:28745_t:CDS:2, partial [Gigaspora margarita]
NAEEITVALKNLFTDLDFDKKASKEFVKEVEYINLYKRCCDSDPENRPQINEVYDIVSNIKSEANKKFYKDIRKAEQRITCSNFFGSNIIIANLSQEFIKLYIKDMITNSNDTINNISNWLENNSENSKKNF